MDDEGIDSVLLYRTIAAAGRDVLAFFGSTVGMGLSSIYFNRLVP